MLSDGTDAYNDFSDAITESRLTCFAFDVEYITLYQVSGNYLPGDMDCLLSIVKLTSTFFFS